MNAIQELKRLAFIVSAALCVAFSFPSTGVAKGKGSGGGGSVHVKGYTRKDGTYVAPHTRSAPGMGAKVSAPVDHRDANAIPIARTKPRTEAPLGLLGTKSGKAGRRSDLVYVTKTGKKYHTATCRHASTGTAIALGQAIGTYGPCSVCHPPTEIAEEDATEQSSGPSNFARELAAEREARKKAEAEAADLRSQIESSKKKIAVERDPDDDEKRAGAKLALAKTLINGRKAAEAKEYLNEILSKYPDTKSAKEAARLKKSI
jgi:hypothetical protein